MILDTLPSELLLIILRKLSWQDLKEVGMVSQALHLISQDNSLWLQHFQHYFSNENLDLGTSKSIKASFIENYIKIQALLESNHASLQYASPHLQSSIFYVLGRVKKDGNEIQYAHEKLRNDFEIALAAVKENGDAIQWINVTLQNRVEIVISTIKRTGFFPFLQTPIRLNRRLSEIAMIRNYEERSKACDIFLNEYLEMYTQKFQGKDLCVNRLRFFYRPYIKFEEKKAIEMNLTGRNTQYSPSIYRPEWFHSFRYSFMR